MSMNSCRNSKVAREGKRRFVRLNLRDYCEINKTDTINLRIFYRISAFKVPLSCSHPSPGSLVTFKQNELRGVGPSSLIV